MSGLDVKFVGEGASGDGLRREWYSLVANELCDPLFGSRSGAGGPIEPNRYSGISNPEHLTYYALLGRIVMLALSYGEVIEGLQLSPRATLRKLLAPRWTMWASSSSWWTSC